MLPYVRSVVALVLISVSYACAQSATERPRTVSERLSGVTNVGLTVDEKLGGFNLVVFNTEQDAENRKKLIEYEKEWGDCGARIRKYQDKIDSATKAGNYNGIDFLVKERDRRPPEPFQDGLKVYQVIHVANDYIELEELYRPYSTLVVPTNRLVRLQFNKASK